MLAPPIALRVWRDSSRRGQRTNGSRATRAPHSGAALPGPVAGPANLGDQNTWAAASTGSTSPRWLRCTWTTRPSPPQWGVFPSTVLALLNRWDACRRASPCSAQLTLWFDAHDLVPHDLNRAVAHCAQAVRYTVSWHATPAA